VDVALSLAAQLELADSLRLPCALVWRSAGRLELTLERPGRSEHDPYLHVVGRLALDEIAGDRSGLRALIADTAAGDAPLDRLPRLLADARAFVRSNHGQIERRAEQLRAQFAALTSASQPAPAPAAA
jgi:hypothetical protein